MYKIIQTIALATAVPIAVPVFASSNSEQLQASIGAVEQLRHSIGKWDVETDFISPESKVYTVKGRYEFTWVIPDKIISGTSVTPELNQTAAILFFHRTAKKEIEMASVGNDGMLWRMIGPENSETRTTPNVTMTDGSTMMLSFTRHSVTANSFGSTMKLSIDGGKTWRVGNHQRFVRAKTRE